MEEPDLEVVAVKRSPGNVVGALETDEPDCVVALAANADDLLVGELAAAFPRARIVVVCPVAVSGRHADPRVMYLDGTVARVEDVASAARSADEPADTDVAVLNLAPGSRRGALSDQEVRILSLMAEGLTTQQIGETLGSSVRAVTSARQRVYAKLGVSSRSQAVATAVREGLVAAGTQRGVRSRKPRD